MTTPKRIHLIGIAGSGMGTFAGLLRAAGHEVRGSDENIYPPMSDRLLAWGIECRIGYRPANLDPAPDLVVVGNVIRNTNPEAQAVIERGLAYTSFPEALGEFFLADRHSIVVAGTHGKTTTTSLIAWLLTQAGRDPSMLVGGVPQNFSEGFRLGKGPAFVVEGDEYDSAYFEKTPKFLHYRPKTAVLTSLEYDHADIYPNVEAIEHEFRKFAHLVPRDGKIFACASFPRVCAQLGDVHASVETYSAREGIDAGWAAREIEAGSFGARFSVVERGRMFGRFETQLSGTHNIEDALAAVAVAARVAGVSAQEIASGLRSFQGVRRRQEYRGEPGGVRIIDDFAHHPTAVRETLSGLRARYPTGRLIAVFEPRSATSSRRIFQDEYAEAFFAADVIVIAGVGRKEIDAQERLDVERLVVDLQGRGKDARAILTIDGIVDALGLEAVAGDTIVFMSNGAFGQIVDKTLKALGASEESRV